LVCFGPLFHYKYFSVKCLDVRKILKWRPGNFLSFSPTCFWKMVCMVCGQCYVGSQFLVTYIRQFLFKNWHKAQNSLIFSKSGNFLSKMFGQVFFPLKKLFSISITLVPCISGQDTRSSASQVQVRASCTAKQKEIIIENFLFL
jgi:hypothetical protein